MEATARAHANIALVKYWGKRDARLNLPAVGSISMTLAGLFSETRARFVEGLDEDRFELDGTSHPGERARVGRFLDRVRARAGITLRAEVSSRNSFPTAAGLASSASGFAALTLAATRAAGLDLAPDELSVLARLGSGSAPRSLYGGFVEMRAGQRADGADAVAVPLAGEDHWPLRMLVAVSSVARKAVGSTAGMQRSADSSPFFPAWVQGAEADLAAAREAIAARDLERLGELMEASCLKMHAVALSGRPGILYWNGTTVTVVHAVRELRAGGVPAYFTIDAGPQVKVLTTPEHEAQVADALAGVDGVLRVIRTGPGPAARLVAEGES